MFRSGPQFNGTSFSGETPSPFGPRNAGQSAAAHRRPRIAINNVARRVSRPIDVIPLIRFGTRARAVVKDSEAKALPPPSGDGAAPMSIPRRDESLEPPDPEGR